MITLLATGHAPRVVETVTAADLTPDILWIDVFRPTAADDQMLEEALGVSLPTEEDITSFEPSSRLYREGDTLYAAATVLCHAALGNPQPASLAFVVTRNRLVTLRTDTPTAVQKFLQHLEQKPLAEGDTHAGVCTRLLEALVDRSADVLEQTSLKIDQCGRQIFRRHSSPTRTYRRKSSGRPDSLEQAIRDIAAAQHVTSGVRESLISIGRMIGFIAQFAPFRGDENHEAAFRAISNDITALTDQSSFLLGNLTFMLDACLGLIDIEQNAIIKIFSVMSVIFLPPTLVASTYGMNFEHMPELQEIWGYPLALLVMLLSAVLPYWYFRRRGWL